MTLMINRIRNLQEKARQVIYYKKAQERSIKKSILLGLQTMRKAILFDQDDLCIEFRFLIPVLNSLLTQKQEIITEVVRLYIQLPIYLHVINLVRWYAQFRNKGVYNKATYFKTMGLIKNMLANLQDLKA